MSRKNRKNHTRLADATDKHAAATAKHAAATDKQDAFHNRLTGLGGVNDPNTRLRFAPGRALGKIELESMYRFNWPARRTVDIIAGDALRQWVEFSFNEPTIKTAMVGLVELMDIEGEVLKAATLARLYGGAVMYLGVLDGNLPEEPLNFDTIETLKFLTTFDRYQIRIAEYYTDPMEAKFGRPRIYEIQPTGVTTAHTRVHETRVLRFDGEFLPEVTKRANQGWDDSVITTTNEALKSFGVSLQSGATLFEDFVTKVLKIPNLADILLKGSTGENELRQRMQFAAAQASNLSISLVGEGEEFSKIQTPITGLVDLMDRFATYLTSANSIPKSRFFGKELGQLSGATETTREYYDIIAVYQKRKLRKQLDTLFRVIMRSRSFITRGVEPPLWSFTFRPLWQMTNAETVDMRLKQSQTDMNNISSGIVSHKDVSNSRFTEQGYSIETQVTEVPDAPPAPIVPGEQVRTSMIQPPGSRSADVNGGEVKA